jgi:uncharacterized protein (TIGR02466 family)
MNEVSITPNLVWKYNYEPGFDITSFEQYIVSTAELHDTEADGGKSTAGMDNMPHEWDCNQTFLKWLKPKLEICASEWDIDYSTIVITGSWTNIHNEKAHTLPHDHGGTSVVASVYVKKPLNSGNIEFEQLLRGRWIAQSRLPAGTIHDYWREISVQQNDVVLFPGWLSHRTQPSKSNDSRIVFTLNIEYRKPVEVKQI